MLLLGYLELSGNAACLKEFVIFIVIFISQQGELLLLTKYCQTLMRGLHCTCKFVDNIEHRLQSLGQIHTTHIKLLQVSHKQSWKPLENQLESSSCIIVLYCFDIKLHGLTVT